MQSNGFEQWWIPRTQPQLPCWEHTAFTVLPKARSPCLSHTPAFTASLSGPPRAQCHHLCLCISTFGFSLTLHQHGSQENLSIWGVKLPPLKPGRGKMPTPHSPWPPQKHPGANTHFHVPVTFRRKQRSHRHVPARDPPFLLPRSCALTSSPSHTSGLPRHLPRNKHSTEFAASTLMKANKPLPSSAGHAGELSSSTRTPAKLLCHSGGCFRSPRQVSTLRLAPGVPHMYSPSHTPSGLYWGSTWVQEGHYKYTSKRKKKM